MFNENTYKDKINSITFLRLISFYIWKFLFGLVLYLLITKLSGYYFTSHYLLLDMKLNFYLTDYIKLYMLCSVTNYLKFYLFQNYEESVTFAQLSFKIVFDPNFQTFFLVLNSLIVYYTLWTLQSSWTNIKELNKTKYFLHITLYRY